MPLYGLYVFRLRNALLKTVVYFMNFNLFGSYAMNNKYVMELNKAINYKDEALMSKLPLVT